jgi:hypothetical protein
MADSKLTIEERHAADMTVLGLIVFETFQDEVAAVRSFARPA